MLIFKSPNSLRADNNTYRKCLRGKRPVLSMWSAKELITKRPGAHGLLEFGSDFVQRHRFVDIVESTPFQTKIQNQSVSSCGKLTFVDPSGVGQRYRSRGPGNMNNPFGTHIVDFFVAQIHPAR